VSAHRDDGLIVDMSQVYQADRRGESRPAPPSNPEHARLLIGAYEEEAAKTVEPEWVAHCRRRIAEIRAAHDALTT
jgi:hypothetical protein